MQQFNVFVPNEDSLGNTPNVSTLQSAMESIATDGLTHNIGQDTMFQSGSFIGQRVIYCWFINDVDLSTAQTNYTTFLNGDTWSYAPSSHYWTIN